MSPSCYCSRQTASNTYQTWWSLGPQGGHAIDRFSPSVHLASWPIQTDTADRDKRRCCVLIGGNLSPGRSCEDGTPSLRLRTNSLWLDGQLFPCRSPTGWDGMTVYTSIDQIARSKPDGRGVIREEYHHGFRDSPYLLYVRPAEGADPSLPII